MTQDEIKKLAIECGAIGGATCVFYIYELEAYTAAVEAEKDKVIAGYKECIDDSYRDLSELQSRIAQLEEALKAECGDRCNAEYNPCAARQLLNDSPSTRLSYLGETK